MKYNNWLCHFTWTLALAIHGLSAQDFNAAWSSMLQTYETIAGISAEYSQHKGCEIDSYTTAPWKLMHDEVVKSIHASPNINFLRIRPIHASMLRQAENMPSFWKMYELNYLRYFLSEKNINILSRFKDSSVGGIKFDCSELQCSVNTLGQMYYFAKILEQKDYSSIKRIIEFGGGYGCLCRIARMVIPDVTYVIFDLPGLIAIQNLYLRLSLPDANIKLHLTVPQHLEQGSINLMPTCFLNEFNFSCDVFISTFAISESPTKVQNIVLEKFFFNAEVCYITGQINGWKPHGTEPGSHDFSNHSNILNGARLIYNLRYLHPHHTMMDNGSICSYEMIAKKG